ncbi:hypothetical protein ACQP1G_20575 [Nocardia sp. CA-107356]|uniref:hypothetical protein n=1 Tax=Nocardia sp. CA-107356 TaxID=3239972 RepID=UPI003D92A463
MDGKAARRGGRRRPVVVAQELEKRRDRRLDRRIAARERQLRVDAAEKLYVDAVEAIEAATRELATEIRGFEQCIVEATARSASLVEQYRHQQSRAAAAIRDEGCTVDEVAEILDISKQQTRQMIAEARHLDQTSPALGRVAITRLELPQGGGDTCENARRTALSDVDTDSHLSAG